MSRSAFLSSLPTLVTGNSATTSSRSGHLNLATAGVARFKWPELLEVVAELPVTKVGKLDKKALREMLAGRSTR